MTFLSILSIFQSVMMNIEDFNCTICLHLCEDAVEASCCGCLFCANCTSGLTECPSCRKTPFQTAVVLSVRKVIGRVEISCDWCQSAVQKSNLTDHKRICHMRQYQCVAEACQFEGLKADLLQHFITTHEKDAINICTGDPSPNSFQSKTVNTSVQTSASYESSLKNDAGRVVQVSRFNMKFYCGEKLPKPCKCLYVHGSYKNERNEHVRYGCFSMLCGPDAGCNCPSCMRLDLKIRGLTKNMAIVNSLGVVKTIKGMDNSRVWCNSKLRSGEKCGVKRHYCRSCNLLYRQTKEEEGLYYGIIRHASLHDMQAGD